MGLLDALQGKRGDDYLTSYSKKAQAEKARLAKVKADNKNLGGTGNGYGGKTAGSKAADEAAKQIADAD